MNACDRYEIMISALLDGELDEREKAELSAHITGCGHCTALAAAFAAVSGTLEEGLEEPPAELHGAIMEKVETAAKVKRSQTRFMRLRPIIAAAACVAVVVVTLLAANRGLRNAMDTAGGSAESYAAAPEAPAYAGAGDGSAAVNGARADTAGVNGAEPMEAPDPELEKAPAGAAMDNAASSEARNVDDAATTEETLAENGNDMAEPESEADVPAGLPELEVEIVAAEAGSFTANVISDPSGFFVPGMTVTILTDEALSPGTRAVVRRGAVEERSGAYYVTADEIEINESA